MKISTTKLTILAMNQLLCHVIPIGATRYNIEINSHLKTLGQLQTKRLATASLPWLRPYSMHVKMKYMFSRSNDASAKHFRPHVTTNLSSTWRVWTWFKKILDLREVLPVQTDRYMCESMTRITWIHDFIHRPIRSLTNNSSKKTLLWDGGAFINFSFHFFDLK